VRDTRFMGRFMARDYVTIREEQRNGRTGGRRNLGRATRCLSLRPRELRAKTASTASSERPGVRPSRASK
jgi:hypothetical protein